MAHDSPFGYHTWTVVSSAHTAQKPSQHWRLQITRNGYMLGIEWVA